jgi:hypothetical protein
VENGGEKYEEAEKRIWMKRPPVIAYWPFFWADSVFAVDSMPPPASETLENVQIEKCILTHTSRLGEER